MILLAKHLSKSVMTIQRNGRACQRLATRKGRKKPALFLLTVRSAGMAEYVGPLARKGIDRRR
jgi:hypothetical protein